MKFCPINFDLNCFLHVLQCLKEPPSCVKGNVLFEEQNIDSCLNDLDKLIYTDKSVLTCYKIKCIKHAQNENLSLLDEVKLSL